MITLARVRESFLIFCETVSPRVGPAVRSNDLRRSCRTELLFAILLDQRQFDFFVGHGGRRSFVCFQWTDTIPNRGTLGWGLTLLFQVCRMRSLSKRLVVAWLRTSRRPTMVFRSMTIAAKSTGCIQCKLGGRCRCVSCIRSVPRVSAIRVVPLPRV